MINSLHQEYLANFVVRYLDKQLISNFLLGYLFIFSHNKRLLSTTW